MRVTTCLYHRKAIFSHTGNNSDGALKERRILITLTQFSWTDYESRLTVTSAESVATEQLVSISLGIVFVVEMASTKVT